jgi:hypothetical protein
MGRGGNSNLLTSGQTCQACHSFTINNVKVQSTWGEWQASSTAKKGVTCQACHFRQSGNPNMPEAGEVANGRARDQVLAHALGGGSTIHSPLLAEGSRTQRFQLPSKAQDVRVRLLWRDVSARFAAFVLKVPGSSIPVRELASWRGKR